MHIASHFRFRAGTNDQSVLLLGRGELLSLERLAGLGFQNAELVTLSACETAVGDADNGSEVEGLGTTVLQGGAYNVIASLWKIGDDSTARFMEILYQLMVRSSFTRAEALRRVQTAFIHAGRPGSDLPPDYAHPNRWAPFILMGNKQ